MPAEPSHQLRKVILDRLLTCTHKILCLNEAHMTLWRRTMTSKCTSGLWEIGDFVFALQMQEI